MIRPAITSLLDELRSQTSQEPPVPLDDESVLLETGLNSLGFAILVARLEQQLGFDPFASSEHAYYPRTLGEFIGFYEKNAPSR